MMRWYDQQENKGLQGLSGVLVVKNSSANAGDIRETGSVPGSGRSAGGGHGNSLQYSCLENPVDRRAWWATVHRVAKSQIGLKWLRIHNDKEREDGTLELRLLICPSVSQADEGLNKVELSTSVGNKISINKTVIRRTDLRKNIKCKG